MQDWNWLSLRDAFDARQESTYGISIHFGVEGAEKLVDEADQFLNKVRQLILKK